MHEESGGKLAVDAECKYLVGAHHVLVKYRAGNRVDERMRNPSPIVTSLDLAEFVGDNFAHCNVIGLWIIFDRDLG